MVISLSSLVVILIGHFVGDFLLQTDYMAVNKSKEARALILHVVFYGLGILASVLFLLASTAATDKQIDSTLFHNLFSWLLINVYIHAFQDCITSRITSYYNKIGNQSAFFNMIGLDQTIHYAILVSTFAAIVRI